jgi:hypothetical protein
LQHRVGTIAENIAVWHHCSMLQMERIVIRVYDLIPGLKVNDPCVTETDQQLSIVMSKPLVSNQVEGDCAEHLFGFSQVSEEFLKTGAGKMLCALNTGPEHDMH